jgi:hypothetical protein
VLSEVQGLELPLQLARLGRCGALIDFGDDVISGIGYTVPSADVSRSGVNRRFLSAFVRNFVTGADGASGSPIPILNRARSSGVAPNLAARNRNSPARVRLPSQNSACNTAVSIRNDQSVSVNLEACALVRHVCHHVNVASGQS